MNGDSGYSHHIEVGRQGNPCFPKVRLKMTPNETEGGQGAQLLSGHGDGLSVFALQTFVFLL